MDVICGEGDIICLFDYVGLLIEIVFFGNVVYCLGMVIEWDLEILVVINFFDVNWWICCEYWEGFEVEGLWIFWWVWIIVKIDKKELGIDCWLVINCL